MVEARALLQRACDLGSPLGCEQLGYTFATQGPDLSPDLARSSPCASWAARGGAEAEAVCARLAVELGGIAPGRMPAFEDGRGATRRPLPPDRPRALRISERACGVGRGEACVVWAELLGWRPEARRALAALERGCNVRGAEACAKLAQVHASGQYVAKNESRARAYAERGCALGSQFGCEVLAGLLMPTRQGVQAYLQAIRLALARRPSSALVSGAGLMAGLIVTGASGDPAALARFILETCGREAGSPGRERDRVCAETAAIALLSPSRASDREQLVRMLRELDELRRTRTAEIVCDETALRLVEGSGDPEMAPYTWVTFPLGIAYEYGVGVPRDRRKAAELYGVSCARRVRNACVGAWALLTVDAPEDRAGIERARVAAEAGELDTLEGLSDLAGRYERGDGVGVDLGMALALRDKGCRAHDSEACRRLGVMLVAGDGTVPNPDAGLRVLRSVCMSPPKDGDPIDAAESCGIVGRLLLASIDASNRDAGAKLLAASCDVGRGASCAHLAVARRDGVLPGGAGWEDLMLKSCLQARPWLGLRAYSDVVPPCLDLASRIRTGDGVPKDVELASQLERYVCGWTPGSGGCPAKKAKPTSESTR